MDCRDSPRNAATGTRTTLGACPRCGEELRRGHLLIEYETSSGPDAFAECPDCQHVVHPR